MIVVCYDGSEDAKAAVESAAALLGAEPATVLTVWEPYIDTLAQTGFGLVYAPVDDAPDIDAALRQRALETAEEGAALLRKAGGTVEALVEQRETSVAAAVLDVARRLDADAIVIGTRGRGGVKSALLGSVSHALVQHADRPVVVVPSAALAAARSA